MVFCTFSTYRSGIAGLYDSSTFSFFKNLHTFFHSGYVNLHCHQQCRKVQFSPHLLLHLFDCRLFNDGHSEWYETIPRGSFDLHFSNNYYVEHLFMCFLVISMSSLEKCQFRSSAHFLVDFLKILSYMSCLYIM